MVTQFDEKGKIFTSIIAKQPEKVLIQLSTNQIRGEIHVKKDNRIKDELDSSSKFIAVTNAIVFSFDGSTILTKCRFMTINVDKIIWVIPDIEFLIDELT
ncbi:MAG: hypothetical protein NTZ74_03625 [Chloroflexi bacterium]|nr:hypothetical protein [Chloroflexota bacterium]